MVTSAQCLKKYGDPNLLATQSKHFVVWQVPSDILTAFSHVLIPHILFQEHCIFQ